MLNLSNLLGNFLKKETQSGVKLVIFRHCESLGEHGGSLVGFTDSKMTIKGRHQAHSLFKGLHQHVPSFNEIYCSDLSRAYDTANIALGFRLASKMIKTSLLRERNFGDEEGLHYDSLPDEKQKKFEDFDYKAEGGENWRDTQVRMQQFIKTLKTPGNYLAFSHGGIICANTFDLGFTDVIPVGSCFGIEIDTQENKFKKVDFLWQMPDNIDVK